MKITLTQAKAIARTLFGDACKFAGTIPSEPDTVCYLFRRGIFALEITVADDVQKIVVTVAHEEVGIIDLYAPKGFEFRKTPAAGFNLDESDDDPAAVLGGKV